MYVREIGKDGKLVEAYGFSQGVHALARVEKFITKTKAADPRQLLLGLLASEEYFQKIVDGVFAHLDSNEDLFMKAYNAITIIKEWKIQRDKNPKGWAPKKEKLHEVAELMKVLDKERFNPGQTFKGDELLSQVEKFLQDLDNKQYKFPKRDVDL